MKVLILHNNYPAQFKHLVPWLVRSGHQVTFLSLESYGVRIAGVKHSVIRKGKHIPDPATFPGKSKQLGRKLDSADLFLGAFRRLKRDGFVPDLVVFHSGWGAGLHLRGVFPNAYLAAYAEWRFRWQAGDCTFEPDYSYRP